MSSTRRETISLDRARKEIPNIGRVRLPRNKYLLVLHDQCISYWWKLSMTIDEREKFEDRNLTEEEAKRIFFLNWWDLCLTNYYLYRKEIFLSL